MARVLSFPSNDVIDIRITGLNVPGPEHLVLYRGYGTVLDTRVRAAWWVERHVRLGAGMRLETSALPAAAVTPATVDGLKIEPTAIVTVAFGRHVWMTAGYGFTYMFPVTASEHKLDPRLANDCAQAGGDLTACEAQRQGLARPTADGHYTRYLHTLSAALTASF